VVQYVPDGARAEGANVGVVLYVPETASLLFRTSPSLARVKQFFCPDESEFEWIAGAVKTLECRLRTAESEFKSKQEFRLFVAARADVVRLTHPRLAVADNLQAKLDELYTRLVGDVPDGARQDCDVMSSVHVAERKEALERAGFTVGNAEDFLGLPPQQRYDFVLILDGVTELTASVEDALYVAGCDDATLCFRCGAVYASFCREASSLLNATRSAIADVRKAGYVAILVSGNDASGSEM
jgi:hypothetical protein